MYQNCLDAENEFERCWSNPKYTAIQLDDVDINHTLSNYTVQKPIHFTQSMLWDMETKKASNPENYISYVVKAGSAKSWHRNPCPITKGEIFVRCSAQKKWLEPSIYENVYEEVYVDENAKLITFLGVTTLPEKNETIHPSQFLFHVQHGVAGTEDKPLNTWRIVHLTEAVDQKLIDHFKKFNDPTTLPGFIESYIKNDLNIFIEELRR